MEIICKLEDPYDEKCASCGSIGILTFKNKMYYVECENRFTTCNMNARTHPQKRAEDAVEDWNVRYGK